MTSLPTNTNLHNQQIVCANISDNLISEFWTATEDFIKSNKDDVLFALYTFGSAMSHCNSTILSTDNNGNGNRDLSRRITDNAKALLKKELNHLLVEPKKAKGDKSVQYNINVHLRTEASIKSILDLLSLYSEEHSNIFDTYCSLRSDQLAQTFSKWIAEAASNSAASKLLTSCGRHMELMALLTAQFEFSLEYRRQYVVYEILNTAFLLPAVRTVTEYLAKNQDKEKIIFLHVAYAFHSLDYQMCKHFERISLGDKAAMFNRPEVLALFKNNSTHLVSTLFEEMLEHKSMSKYDVKQIWHWRIPFCSNLPALLTSIRESCDVFCNDIAKTPKSTITEGLLYNGKTWKCIPGTNKMFMLSKCLTFFIGWDRHNAEITGSIVAELYDKIAKSFEKQANKFPSSLSLTKFDCLLTSVTFVARILRERFLEIGFHENKLSVDAKRAIVQFDELRYSMVERLCKFEKTNTECFYLFRNPFYDYSNLKDPETNEIASNLQLWRMSVHWLSVKLNLPECRQNLIDVFVHNISILFRMFSHQKPSEARRNNYTSHITYVLHVIKYMLIRLSSGPSELLSTDGVAENIHALAKNLLGVLIVHGCQLSILSKICQESTTLRKHKHQLTSINHFWMHLLDPSFYPETSIHNFSNEKISFVVEVLCKLLSESTSCDYVVVWLTFYKNGLVTSLFLKQLDNEVDNDETRQVPPLEGQLSVVASFLHVLAYASVDSSLLTIVLEPFVQAAGTKLNFDDKVTSEEKVLKLFEFYKKKVFFRALCRIANSTVQKFFKLAFRDSMSLLSLCQSPQDTTFPPFPCGCMPSSGLTGEDDIRAKCHLRLFEAAKSSFDSFPSSLQSLIRTSSSPLIQFLLAHCVETLVETVVGELSTKLVEILPAFVVRLLLSNNDIFLSDSSNNCNINVDIDHLDIFIAETQLRREYSNIAADQEGKLHLDVLRTFLRKNGSWLSSSFKQSTENAFVENSSISGEDVFNPLDLIDEASLFVKPVDVSEDFSIKIAAETLTPIELHDLILRRAEFWDETLEISTKDQVDTIRKLISS